MLTTDPKLSRRSSLAGAAIVAWLHFEPQSLDAAFVGVQHGELHGLDQELLVSRRQAADVREQETTDGLVLIALGQVDVESFVHLVDVHARVDGEERLVATMLSTCMTLEDRGIAD